MEAASERLGIIELVQIFLTVDGRPSCFGEGKIVSFFLLEKSFCIIESGLNDLTDGIPDIHI